MLYTPLSHYTKKKLITYRFQKNIFLKLLFKIFWEEYYPKITDPLLLREITDSTLKNVEGRKWAEKFHKQRFKNFQNLEKQKIGLISADKAYPIFKEIESFINDNKLENDRNLHLIQVGSCSGADLKFFYDIFPHLNFISTDITNDILDFQREKYNLKNFHFFKTHAENIDDCFKKFELYNKKVIIFSIGSLQYVNPYFLEIFFSKLQNVKDLDLFILDTIDLEFIKNQTNLKSKHRNDIVYNHRYADYVKNNQIIKNKVIEPYSKNDNKNKNTAHTFLHINNLKKA